LENPWATRNKEASRIKCLPNVSLARTLAFQEDDNCGMTAERRGTNQILSAIVILTIALAAIAALLTSTQDSKEYATSTPEGVVQRYLRAVIDGKNEEAVRYFSQSSTCDATDIDRSWMPENVRVNLSNSRIESEKAYIDVAVDISSGGPFDDYYTEKHTFRLSRENGIWKILGIPWPLYSCDELNK
jgi:hypothetical protein